MILQPANFTRTLFVLAGLGFAGPGFTPLGFATPTRAADVHWETNLDKTLERAKTEHKVVFLAVNMDGERANERMIDKVYTDAAIVELSKSTLNLIASVAEHAAVDKPCPKFKGLVCLDHRKTDSAARSSILKADGEGFIVAPQHVFLDAEGAVILSVPYEVSADELTWCFATALKKADPAWKGALPADARMPRRTILGGVYEPEKGEEGASVPPTKKELTEMIKELKKGGDREKQWPKVRRILLSDEPEALDFVKDELRSGGGGGPGGGGGGGGGKGGGGGGGGGGGRDGGSEKHKRLLHMIGVLSPPAYWKLCVDPIDDHDVELRTEAIVALEQIAAPEALKDLTAALQDEKDPRVQKELLRAIGACGAADARSRTMLTKKAKSEKNELLKLNAIVALGALDPDPAVKDELRSALAKGTDKEKVAAACAMALSRDDAWLEEINALLPEAKDPEITKALTAARDVLKGGKLGLVADHVQQVAEDKVERERLFGPRKKN